MAREEVDTRRRPAAICVPQLVAGRNLLPEDGHAILFNQKIATGSTWGSGTRW
jgi:hypothetical protein